MLKHSVYLSPAMPFVLNVSSKDKPHLAAKTTWERSTVAFPLEHPAALASLNNTSAHTNS